MGESEVKTAAARTGKPTYKFQRLEVYQLALEYLDLVYELAKTFPAEEKYNLTSQLQRAATSIVLNIAEARLVRATLSNIGFWVLPCGLTWKQVLVWILPRGEGSSAKIGCTKFESLGIDSSQSYRLSVAR